MRGMQIMVARQTRAAVAAATADSEATAKAAADAEIRPPPSPAPAPQSAGAAEAASAESGPAAPGRAGDAGEAAAAVRPEAEEKKKKKKFRWAQPEREYMPEEEAQPFTWKARPLRAPYGISMCAGRMEVVYVRECLGSSLPRIGPHRARNAASAFPREF